MRLSTDRRWARAVLLSAVTFTALASCDSKPKDTGPVSAAGGSATSGTTARQAADEFLTALRDGKATTDRLTAAFRTAIAPPKTDDEKKAGYSESDARDWLGRFAGSNFVVGEEVKLGDAVSVRGRAESPNRKEAFALRMVKDGDAFKVDWLHRSERIGLEIKAVADPDLAAAQDAVRNFLDLLIGGDLRQAATLMTPAWRKRTSPPHPPDERAGLDHNPGFLIGSMKSWNKNYIGYTLPKAELNKEAATFTAEMDAGAMKSPFIVRAIKDKATGWWLVEAFDKQ